MAENAPRESGSQLSAYRLKRYTRMAAYQQTIQQAVVPLLAVLNETGWRPEAIERQMAHRVSDSVRRHYNYAQHVPEPRIMMQA